MPIAAVPDYLQREDFTTATPGMRYGLLLNIWTARADQEKEVHKRASAKSREGQQLKSELENDNMDAVIDRMAGQPRGIPRVWDKSEAMAQQAWKEIIQLTKSHRELMEGLRKRQHALANSTAQGSVLTLQGRATAPFTTGLGNEHPLENGFAFLNPYGMPYLAGSGVKGVLRCAARELAQGEWGETQGWTEQAIEALFGRAGHSDGNDTTDSDGYQRGALQFWDVFPELPGDSLRVEIMTPHQSHYLQGEDVPHESGQPNPITFLAIPPDTRFGFHVRCDEAHLKRFDPELASGQRWRDLVEAAFEIAFEWIGFGAKTAAGYGAMERDTKAEKAAEEAQKSAEEAAKLKSMTPEELSIAKLEDLLEKDKEANRKEAQGELAQARTELLKQAPWWDSAELRRKAAAVIDEAFKWTGWTSNQKRKYKSTLDQLKS